MVVFVVTKLISDYLHIVGISLYGRGSPTVDQISETQDASQRVVIIRCWGILSVFSELSKQTVRGLFRLVQQ